MANGQPRLADTFLSSFSILSLLFFFFYNQPSHKPHLYSPPESADNCSLFQSFKFPCDRPALTCLTFAVMFGANVSKCYNLSKIFQVEKNDSHAYPRENYLYNCTHLTVSYLPYHQKQPPVRQYIVI